MFCNIQLSGSGALFVLSDSLFTYIYCFSLHAILILFMSSKLAKFDSHTIMCLLTIVEDAHAEKSTGLHGDVRSGAALWCTT